MQFLSNKFKKFDVHLKAIDGAYQQTLLGAIVTIAATIIVMSLVVSEVSTYLSKDVVSRMITDDSIGKNLVKLEFDIEFNKMGCNYFHFTQENIRGETHSHDPDVVVKDVVGNGCRIHGHTIIDKVGGNVKFGIQNVESIGPDVELSHTIHHLMFIPYNSKNKIGTVTVNDFQPLSEMKSNSAPGTGLHYYAVQVVPTEYQNVRGEISISNQYSVAEHTVSIDRAILGVSISNQYFKDVVGIIISYDFYPVSYKNLNDLKSLKRLSKKKK